MRTILVVALCLGALATSRVAQAMDCTVTTVSGVAFGAYDVFDSSPTDSTGVIGYRCTNVGAADKVMIDLSAGQAPSFFPRRLLLGAYQLVYNLYLDASRTNVWGNGTGGTSHYGPASPEEGVEKLVSVYGRIPARQNVRVGGYSDTVVVTVSF